MSWLYAAAKQQRGIRQLFGDFMSQHFNIKSFGSKMNNLAMAYRSVEILEIKIKIFCQCWDEEQNFA